LIYVYDIKGSKTAVLERKPAGEYKLTISSYSLAGGFADGNLEDKKNTIKRNGINNLPKNNSN
jgi:hypothetical protein